ncbi:uncharacterized protein [Eurosta solidaginis]|uniref:uncharacterized protein n=1 Tax=Eurosta solidaginis TaxID=178769 RepID=UPI0035309A8E
MSIDGIGFLLAGTYTMVRVVEAIDNGNRKYENLINLDHASRCNFTDSALQLGAGIFVGSILGYGAYLSSRDPPRPLFQISTELLLTGMLGTRFKINRESNDGALLLVTAAAAIYSSCNYHKYLRQQLDIDEFLGLDTRRKVTIKIPDMQKAMKDYQEK